MNLNFSLPPPSKASLLAQRPNFDGKAVNINEVINPFNPFVNVKKTLTLLLFVWAVCLSQLVLAKTAPVVNYLRPDGTLNAGAIGQQQLSLDLKGWDVHLDPKLGPVFSPAAAPTADGWSALDKGLGAPVFAIAVSGSDVYVGGQFSGVGAGGTAVSGLNYIAKWNGTAWSALGKGLNTVVNAIAVSGSDVYVGGNFTGEGPGGTAVAGLNYIAKWNGTDWSALDKGLNGFVFAIAVSGTDVYVGGNFTGVSPDGMAVDGLSRIAKWNGTAWSALDKGLNGLVSTIAVSGSDVYVGGTFGDVGIGGTAVSDLKSIAKWNGSAWSALDKGLNGSVRAIVVSGSDFYVGGTFTNVGVGGTTVDGLNRIAKWNGTAWSALDQGLGGQVNAIAVSGSSIYAGGNFTNVGVGGTTVDGLNRIAKWNGSAWSALDKGLGSAIVNAVAISGSSIYAGGSFTAVGTDGMAVAGLNRIAKWGSSCTPVTPSVSIAASSTGTIDLGTSVTFTATPTNGGTTPSYQWKKNGNDVGDNSATYTDAVLLNGDKITCVMTSSDACASPTTATSNELTMSVNEPAALCVTVTGCSGVSGTYNKGSIFIGNVSNNRLVFSDNVGHIIYHDGSNWYLVDFLTLGYLFSISSTSALPPTSGWGANPSAICSGATLSLAVGACVTCTTPTAYNVTGGGSFCAGGTGVAVGLSNSESGVTYQLKNSTGNVGTPVSGTGSAISFGNQTVAETYTVEATRTTGGCTATMTGNATVSITALPTVYFVTGGGAYCAGGSGVAVGLSNSQTEVNYQLKNGSTNVGSPLAGTGSAISFGNQTTAGIYSVVATTATGNCTANMTDYATVSIAPLPTVYSVTGGGSFCTGGTGVSIGLSSSETGVSYQLKNGSTNVGSPVAGTGSAISFGNQTTAGTYTVEATKTTLTSTRVGVGAGLAASGATCTATMTGNATVSITALPIAYNVTGGGAYCSGGTGVAIGLSNSQTGVNYQLKNGSTDVGSPLAGTGSAISFGNQTTAGIYKVVASTATDNCPNNMNGNATISINSLPTTFNVTGGGSFCAGGTGVSIGLSNSETGVSYQLKNGSTNVGSPVAGTGSALSFGFQTGAGAYTIAATNISTSCTTSMTGNASVVVYALPTASISGNATVCKDSPPSVVSFTGLTGQAPFTFTYKINGGVNQTVGSSGSSASVTQSTSTPGIYGYTLVSVADANGCSQPQSGSITLVVLTKPSISLRVQQTTVLEGGSQTLCASEANASSSSLVFNVGTACISGNPFWRVQVGGVWGSWTSSAPSTQATDNQLYRYQAACDANCPNTYTDVISLRLDYRASTPQNVSLVADGVTVAAGESKEVCDVAGNTIAFNATCGVGEQLLYSVDGSDYSIQVPEQQVDGQWHNYRVRCRKANGTVSCVETESGVMRLKMSAIAPAPIASLSTTSSCGIPSNFSGTANCGSLTTVWYNATSNAALPNLPTTTPTETVSYYARCQNEAGCQGEKSNVVTFTLTPVNAAPVVSVSSDVVCTGTEVTVSTSCPAGATVLWNTGVTESSFKVAFSNVTTQVYSAKCVFANGCQSTASATKTVLWKAFELTIINIGESKSAVKTNDRSAWASQFVTPDGGPSLDQSTESNPTLYYSENLNKTAPRYWTIHVDACSLGETGSLTYDMLSTPETGVVRSYNTHENNAPYFMYANRSGYTELYAQNHPIYGFYQDNGSGGNVYDEGLPKGLYKLGIRYWDMKGWGSIYPSTRKPQGNVLAYQEYWFRIQSKDGVGKGAAREMANGQEAKGKGSDNGKQLTDDGAFATVIPNPVSTVLRLKVQDSKGQVVQTTLIDASGRGILQRQFVPTTNTHQEEYGVGELPTGMYFLKVNTEKLQTVLKVVKVN